MIKDLLEDYKQLTEKINNQENKLAYIDCQLNKITQIISDLPKGSKSKEDEDKLATLVAEKIDLEKDLMLNIMKRLNARRDIEKAIKVLPEQEQLIIQLKHFNQLSWGKIADTMHYAVSTVKNKHSKIMK